MKKNTKRVLASALSCAFLLGSVSTAGAAYHTVCAGEWLSTIAPKYDTTWEVLAELNGLSNPNLIYPGQVLELPADEIIIEIVEVEEVEVEIVEVEIEIVEEEVVIEVVEEEVVIEVEIEEVVVEEAEEVVALYKATQVEDAVTYEPPGHYDVTPLRLHSAADIDGFITMGLSFFDIGGYADMAVTTDEMLYYIIEGEMTVATDDGEVYVLQAGDSIHFGPGVGRQPENTYDGVTKMLVASCPALEDATQGLYAVVYAEGAIAYEAVGHYDVTPTRLHNPDDVEGSLMVGLSHFEATGGADMADAPAEMIYYVIDGEMTVTTGDGEVNVLQNDDSIHFDIGVGRQPENTYGDISQMLVISCSISK